MTNKLYFVSFIFLLCMLSGCGVKNHLSNSKPITHELWTSLLKDHVSIEGNVNYKGFVQDSVRLNKYIDLLKNNHPNESSWSKDERLAYWLNAYNAFTVKLVVDNYPVKSIKDIKKGIVFVNSVWDIKFIYIEGVNYDLNNIEHSIIRKRFDEPRIHFALNCASVSCPRLRNEAFTANKLESQLVDQTKYFLSNSIKNKIAADKMELSKIFSWFGGDFKKQGTLIEFLNQYAPVKINADAKKKSLPYDWNLNE